MLHRLVASDARVALLVAFALVAVHVGSLPRGRHAAAIGATLVLVAWQSFFYESGHTFSLIGLDVRLGYAVASDAPSLGSSFWLALVEHFAPWLMLGAVFLEGPQARPGALAMLLGPTVAAYGAFRAFGREPENHWLTMHAAPVFLFAICNVALAGLAALVVIAATRRGSG